MNRRVKFQIGIVCAGLIAGLGVPLPAGHDGAAQAISPGQALDRPTLADGAGALPAASGAVESRPASSPRATGEVAGAPGSVWRDRPAALGEVRDNGSPGRDVVEGDIVTPVPMGDGAEVLVSNVTASQRTDGTFRVDIHYDLAGAANVSETTSVQASDDGGLTWTVPLRASSLSGDVGSGITPGAGKHIVWDCAADLPAAAGTLFKIRVCAPSLGSETVLIPAGEFVMGDHHDGMSSALPLHAVYTDAFYMDKFEVTNQQYADALNWAWAQGNLITVMNGVVYKHNSGTSYPYCDTIISSPYSRITWNGNVFGVVGQGLPAENPGNKTNHPMVWVSWYGSAAYANWRSAMEERTPSYDTATWECNFAAGGYRLPTEAEWEKAARGGSNSPHCRYPWGDTLDGSNANYRQSSDPYDGTYPSPETTPVGYFDGSQLPPGVDMANGYGLYDMAGNVWEWCNDWWNGLYYDVRARSKITCSISPPWS